MTIKVTDSPEDHVRVADIEVWTGPEEVAMAIFHPNQEVAALRSLDTDEALTLGIALIRAAQRGMEYSAMDLTATERAAIHYENMRRDQSAALARVFREGSARIGEMEPPKQVEG